MDVERANDYASKGVANGGLVTGIIGTAGAGVSLITSLLAAINSNKAEAKSNATGAEVAMAAMIPALATAIPAVATRGSSCESDHTVTRYDAAQAAEIARLNTELKLRDANTYTDQKMLELYQYVDSRLRGVEGQLSQQAVYNATNTAALTCLQGQVAQLQGLTKLIVPNSSVCPGWGNVTVSPETTTAA